MPTLRLINDQDSTHVSVAEDSTDQRSRKQGASAKDVTLTTNAMLKFAGEAAHQGMRIQSVRLDDVNRLDDPALAQVQEFVVAALRKSDVESAVKIILNWPTVLIITDLALRDSQARTVMRLSRNGTISFGAGVVAQVKSRIQSIIASRPDLFAS